MKKTLSLIFGLAMSATSFAQIHQELAWHVSGLDFGTTVFDQSADGVFKSESHLKVATTKIDSVFSGKLLDGKLVEFRLEQSTSGKTAIIVGKDGKTAITVDNKTTNGVFTPPKAFFANYHPFSTGSIVAAFDPTGLANQKIDAYVIDALEDLKFEATRLDSKNLVISGTSQTVDQYRLSLPGVPVQVFLDPAKNVVGWKVATQKLEVLAKGYEELVVDPTTKIPELSQPTFQTQTDKLVKVPMRDGVELAADIARPRSSARFPVILSRTPYGREAAMLESEWWAKRGYVFIAQDVRGRGDSKGAWDPMMPERKDGFDTIAWIAKQSWCDGNVGMIGGSYLGMVQWQAAVERPPALKCIVPQVSPPDMFYNIPYDHGIPMLMSAVWWSRVVSGQSGMAGAFDPMKGIMNFNKLPIPKVDEAVLGYNVPFMDSWWKRTTNNEFAPANYQDDLNKVNIPALMISGWWDGDGIGTKMNWAYMRAMHKPNQYLIYGPWTHLFNTTSRIGDVDYGPQAILELNTVYLRWFDTWLKGKNVLGPVPKVQVFVAGQNKWANLDDWPPKSSSVKTLYFAPNGKLSSTKTLSSKPDTYVYDPSKAKLDPKMGNIDPNGGSTIIRVDPKEKSILLYKTDKLGDNITAAGPISVDLHFKTDVKDTDFFAMLLDEDEKGVMRLTCMPGKLRASYRKGMNSPELLKPGQNYEITLDLWDTAHQFKKGHRIVVLLTSMSFPGFARNLNTGEPIVTGTRMIPAKQSIFHDKMRASALRFQVLK